MAQSKINYGTFKIEKQYKQAPEKVWRAFSDPGLKRKWFGGGEGFEIQHYEMDFRVGGFERTRFTHEHRGHVGKWTNDTWYMEIVENERITIAYTMTMDGAPFSSSLQTVEFVPILGGTKLTFNETLTATNEDDLRGRREGTEWLLGEIQRVLDEAFGE